MGDIDNPPKERQDEESKKDQKTYILKYKNVEDYYFGKQVESTHMS